MLIFLIGMPGSGKSYWMRKFAAATDYVGQDTDWQIRRAQNAGRFDEEGGTAYDYCHGRWDSLLFR
jgi:shikimate kinase